MTIIGAALPGISLIVGGMVIMNIMLVSVAERTHEIGIRKSLGARRKDILRQFLIESATLSTLGAMIGIVVGTARREDHFAEHAAARRGRAVVDRRGDAARHRRRNRVGRLPGAPGVAARSHRSAATRDMRLFAQRHRRRSRASASRSTRFASNKGRAALTILGVAVGVFVVVALSSVVRGVNESFARDVAAAGPTSFFVYRRPIGGFQSCDPSDPNSCPERRNPAITNEEAHRHRAAVVDLRGDAARRAAAHVQVSRPLAERRHRVLHAELDRRRRRRHLSRPQLHLRRVPAAARVVIVNDKLAEALFGESDPIDKVDLDQRPAVHRHRSVSLHGEPDGHADVRRRRRFAQGDRAARDGRRHMNLWVRGQQPHRQAARWREGRRCRGRRHRVSARLSRPAPARPDELRRRDAGQAAGHVQSAVRHVLRRRHRAVVGRPARRRHRRHRDHDDLGHRANARDRRSQSARRDARDDSLAVPRRGGDAHRLRRRARPRARRRDIADRCRTAWPSIPASTPLSSVISALVASAFTGVLFGMLPAIRAARLDPVVALRHE